jgi:hypothetical protein
MIAYAHEAMSLLDRLRDLLAGPPRIQGGDAEEAAALREEFGTSDEGAADVRRMETGGGPAAARLGGSGATDAVRFGGSEAAEAAEADLSEEAPPDPET